MSVSLGLGFFSRSAVADMICPDWQYPQCTTSRLTHAFCTAFAARDDKPSIVVTWRLATAETGAEHERNVCPSTWTVQAPHCAIPHPYLVPVRPRSSRMTQSSGVSGSPSNSRRVPLMLSVMDMLKLLVSEKDAWRGGSRQDAGQAAPDSIHAAINAPSCACVPGAGSRFPPGIQPQPTSESWAICSWIAASVLPPLRRGSLICSQI